MASKKKDTQMTERTPVAARGVELLALIAAAMTTDAGYAMLTKDEAADAIAAGHAVANTDITEGNTAAVKLTEAGQAELAKGEQAPVAAAAPVSGKYEIDDNVPMPTVKRGGRTSSYPFEALEVGKSFHVPKRNADDDVVARLASSITSARAKFAEPVLDDEGKPKFETVVVRNYERGEDGKIKVDAEGKRIRAADTSEERAMTNNTRDFMAYPVDASDPRGEGARVFRTA